MPKATKIVVHYDDGSTWEAEASRTGSIFMNEAKAIACGHHPPYDRPSYNANGMSALTANGTASSSTSAAGDDEAEAGTCYYVNGVIFCP